MPVTHGEVYAYPVLIALASLPLKFIHKFRTILTVALILSAGITGSAYAQTEEFASDPDEIEALYQAGKYKEALDAWMIKAFEGEAEAQFKVGTMFREGQGVTPDPEQSVYWYLQAARQDHIAAQYNLGHAFMSGSGAEKDEPEAVRWWTSAAEAGDELAQFNVGRAYYMGIGATKDEDEAKRWFVAAAAQGEPRSQALVNRLGWNTEEPASPSSATAATPALDADTATPVEPAPAPTPTPAPQASPEPTPTLAEEPTKIAEPEVTPLPTTESASESETVLTSATESEPVSETSPSVPALTATTDETEIMEQPSVESTIGSSADQRPTEPASSLLDDETTVPAHLVNKTSEMPEASPTAPKPAMPTEDRAPLPSNNQALVAEHGTDTNTMPGSQVNTHAPANPLQPPRRPTAITDGPTNAVVNATNARRAEQNRQIVQTPAQPLVQPPAQPTIQPRQNTSQAQASNTMSVATSNNTRSTTRTIDTFSIDRAMVIYQNSNTRSNTLGILPTGEQVDVVEKSGHWLKIRRRTGIPMWVSSRYLRTTTTDAGRITGDSVNVRATPAIIDTNKLGQLQNGEAVGVQCAGRDWSFITSPSDFTGWILADHGSAPAPLAVSDCPAIPSIESPLGRPATQVAANAPQLTAPTPAPTEFESSQDDNWLFAQQAGNFTIQLAKFQTPAGLTQYLEQNQLTGDSLLKQFTQTSVGQTQAYLLYGSYRTQTEALQRARELGAVNPWIRNISVVRENRCRRWNIQKSVDDPASRFCA